MPSPELTQLVEKFESEENQNKRLSLLDDMWELQDPEAILILKILYEEGDNKKIRNKAAEILGKYKGLEQQLRGKKKKGGGALRGILTLTLLLFIVANVGLFVLSSGDDNEESPGTDAAALRANLLGRIENNLNQADSLARELRRRAIDYDDNIASLEEICTDSPGAVPDPIEMTEQERNLFPDIAEIIDEETSDYNFALLSLGIAYDSYQSACNSEDGSNPTAQQIKDFSDEAIVIITEARDDELEQLVSRPYATPTPSVEPSATPTTTPSLTPTPSSRERQEIIDGILVQPARIEADAQEIVSRITAVDRGGDLATNCRDANFWNPPGIMLRGEEPELYPDIAEFAQNGASRFNIALQNLATLKANWREVCDSGRATASDIQTLRISGNQVIAFAGGAQTEVDQLFGN